MGSVCSISLLDVQRAVAIYFLGKMLVLYMPIAYRFDDAGELADLLLPHSSSQCPPTTQS